MYKRKKEKNKRKFIKVLWIRYTSWSNDCWKAQRDKSGL